MLKEITSFVRENNGVSLTQIHEALDRSPETVRSALDILAGMGIIQKKAEKSQCGGCTCGCKDTSTDLYYMASRQPQDKQGVSASSKTATGLCP